MWTRLNGVGPQTGGVMLMIAGAVFALERLTSRHGAWQWLPLFVLYLAVRDLWHPPAGQSRTFVPVLAGLWLQVSAIGLLGFDFLNSWPLLIALVGLGLVIDGLVRGAQPETTLPAGEQ